MQEESDYSAKRSGAVGVRACPSLGGFDQRFENVERSALDAVAKGEFVDSRKLLNSFRLKV
jgi:hypothetical protein